MRILQKILLLSVLLCLASTSPLGALAPEQKSTFRGGIRYFNSEDALCASGTSTGAVASGQLGDTLEGHTLPAASGGAAKEEEAHIVNGRARLVRNGAPLALFPAGVTENDVKFYMDMRWRYVLWAWDGTTKSAGAAESGSWYKEAVRKVLVTNPATGKSIVAAIIEAGPAPWTGTPENNKASPPSYWQGYVDGTPAEYNGFVAGLSPSTYEALGGPAIQWTRGKGVALNYSWADQSLVSGTIIENGKVTSTPSSASGCASGQPAGVENFVFYSQYDPKWKDYRYGSSTIGPSGCGPTAVAMVVATLVDSKVTPKETADYGTAQNYLGPSGSSWAFFEEGVKNWGLNSTNIGKDYAAARSALQSGGLVIAAGQGPMPFTDQGHIIVIRGIDEKGDFLVGDSQETSQQNKAYSQSSLSGTLKNMWVITK